MRYLKENAGDGIKKIEDFLLQRQLLFDETRKFILSNKNVDDWDVLNHHPVTDIVLFHSQVKQILIEWIYR